jgi:hypothetical protein
MLPSQLDVSGRGSAKDTNHTLDTGIGRDFIDLDRSGKRGHETYSIQWSVFNSYLRRSTAPHWHLFKPILRCGDTITWQRR